MIGNQVFVTLTELTCYKCIIHFAMDSSLYERRVNDGDSFYCPNGHSQHFTESTVQKLEKQLQSAKSDASYYRNRTEYLSTDLEHARRSKAAIKGQLTKTRNRIANGVCPCCNRSFSNVGRHMTTKHPDFKAVVG